MTDICFEKLVKKYTNNPLIQYKDSVLKYPHEVQDSKYNFFVTTPYAGWFRVDSSAFLNILRSEMKKDE